MELSDESVREALGATREDDGIFFMSATDFVNHWEEVTSVRLWDASWSVTSTSGYFFRGTKTALAIADYETEAEDELPLAEGDTVVLTDMQGAKWWKGFVPPLKKKSRVFRWRRSDDDEEAEGRSFPKAAVKVEGESPLRRFALAAQADTEAVIVLLQPDLRTRRSYEWSREQRCHEKHQDYSNVQLTVCRPGEEDAVLATAEGEERKVLVSVPLGPTPVHVSIADYGGAGSKYQLLVYSRSPASITRLGGHWTDDKVQQLFAFYDADGDGLLSLVEMERVLLELDLLSDLDAEQQRARIEEQFELADQDGEGVDLEMFKAWLCELEREDDESSSSDEEDDG